MGRIITHIRMPILPKIYDLIRPVEKNVNLIDNENDNVSLGAYQFLTEILVD